MNYNKVRSFSKPYLTTNVGNTSVQLTRLITGVFSFDIWFNPKGSDLCHNVGFEFELRPNRENTYNQFIKSLENDYDQLPVPIKNVADDLIKQLNKGRNKGNLLKLFHGIIQQALYDYEKLPNVSISSTSFNYKIDLGEKQTCTITFGLSQGRRHVSSNFILGTQTFGFRDTTGQWSVDGILLEIKRQLGMRLISRKEHFFNMISFHIYSNKEPLNHLLHRLNNNVAIF